MKTIMLLALCLCGLLSCPGSALAQFDGNPEVPVLVQNADVVCVAKIVAVTQGTPVKFEANHRGPVFIDAQSAVAQVAVQSVLKGKISPKSIEVAFFNNAPHDFSNPMNPSPFTELAG